MKGIHYLVELTVKPGKLAEFRKMADWFIDRSEADEPETMGYQWYLSEDKTKCYLHESFADSAGLVKHAGGPNVQGHIGELLKTCDITRFEAFGNPTKAAREVLDGFQATVYPHYGGFTR